jgi:tRNA threonylcarbamoyladenosine biosynthesis protein TsaE
MSRSSKTFYPKLGVDKLYRVETYSPQETLERASRLGRKLKGGELIALEGELGAGKTHFVKGLAAGLGAEETVTSPTFTLINIYEGKIPLAHFDVYRLPTPQAIEELGFEEFFYGPGVTAVEWSDLIKSYLPSQYLLVKIERVYTQPRGESRRFTFIPYGRELELLVEELKKDAGSGN